MAFARLGFVLCLAILVGCGGGSSSSSGGNPPPPPPPSGPPSGSEFLYQNSFASDMEVSTVNPGSGVLSGPTDAAPASVVENLGLHPLVTPSAKFLYVRGFDQDPNTQPPVSPVNAIYCFSITGVEGQLTSVPGSPFIASNLSDPSLFIGETPNGMVMDGQGRFLYLSDYDGVDASGQSTNSIRAYTIDATSGALQNGPVFTSTSVAWLSAQAIDSTNRYLYASTVLSNGVAISVYSIDASTETLTEIAGSPFLVRNTDPDQEYNLSIFAAPSSNFVYAIVINNYGDSGAYVFSADSTTGELTVVPGSPFSIGDPASAILHPSGKFLYATAPGTGISVFALDANSGAVSPTPVSTGPVSGYFGLTLVDPDGQVLLFNTSNDTASSFLINGSTGALTAVTGSPFTVAPGWESAIVVKIP